MHITQKNNLAKLFYPVSFAVSFMSRLLCTTGATLLRFWGKHGPGEREESTRNTREVRFLLAFFFFFFVRLDMTTAAEETLCYQAIYWINSSHLNLKQSAIIMSSPAAQPLAHNSYNLTHLIPKPLMWKVTIAEYWSVSLCLLWE